MLAVESVAGLKGISRPQRLQMSSEVVVRLTCKDWPLKQKLSSEAKAGSEAMVGRSGHGRL